MKNKEKGMKRLVTKRIIKPSKTTVKIGTEKMDNILDEANIYFKGELEEAKKSLFS